LAVKIRMKKMGSKKKPFFRLVAADSRSPRDGRFIETLGYYNPISNPPDIKLDDDKVFKWLDSGAIPSENARQILKKAGLLERWELLKSGVAISELDARIEERRAKQPKAKPKTEKKLSKKKAAAAKADAEAKKEADAAPAEVKEDTEAPAEEVTQKADTADTEVEAESKPEDEAESKDEGGEEKDT